MDEAITRTETDLQNASNDPNKTLMTAVTVPASRYLVYMILAAGGGMVDLVSKEWIFRWRGLPGELPPWWFVEPFVGIETAVNQGALFGMGQGKGWLFAYVSIAAALGILAWLFVWKAAESKWITVTMGFVTAGIIGNLYDRLNIPNMPPPFSGGVRDWILFTYEGYVWPNFNIADALLVTGAIMLAVHSLFLQRKVA